MYLSTLRIDCVLTGLGCPCVACDECASAIIASAPDESWSLWETSLLFTVSCSGSPSLPLTVRAFSMMFAHYDSAVTAELESGD